MKKENLLHIRYNHQEAALTKKHMLNTEIALLKVIQILRTYNKLRKEEFKIKEKFKGNLRDIRNNIEKIEDTMPEIKKPDILKDWAEKEAEIKQKEQEKKEKSKKEGKYSDKIEKELQEIQERLNKIE